MKKLKRILLSKLRNILLIELVLMSTFSYGQKQENWQYPSGLNLENSHGDTSFYSDGVSIWIIKKRNILFEYHQNGNLLAISNIKLTKTIQVIDTDQVKKSFDCYTLNGESRIFFYDTTNTIAVIGHYKNNEIVGVWKYYNKSGNLIEKSYPMLLWRRTDYFNEKGELTKQIDIISSFFEGEERVREVEFVDGKEITIYNKTLFAKLYLRFTVTYMILFFFFFFSRIFINSNIYNIENGTNLSPLYFFIGPFVSKNFEHSIICTFTFWFFSYKPENRKLVIISNTFSIIALVLFFGAIIGLIISGEI